MRQAVYVDSSDQVKCAGDMLAAKTRNEKFDAPVDAEGGVGGR